MDQWVPILDPLRNPEGTTMTETSRRGWNVDEFFAWQETQTERYELVDGFPLRLMAGARNVHDDIVVNVLAELRNQLRGTGCRPFTGDGSAETKPGQIRRPDIGVDCGRRDPNGLKASSPRLIAEVLSPTTRDFDTISKLDEYKTIATLDRILIVEPNAPEVVVWGRDADRMWRKSLYTGLDSRIDMPEIGVTLALADIYDGVEFPPRPRLVLDIADAPPSKPNGG
jgi:Uma2 family endonuclease